MHSYMWLQRRLVGVAAALYCRYSAPEGGRPEVWKLGGGVGTLRFVDRHNDGDTHVVVLRYAALFYWAYWPTLLATACAFFFTSTATTVVAIVAWSLLMLTAIPYWPVVFELKRRMRSGPITASGSKYSLANPLTYRWTDAAG